MLILTAFVAGMLFGLGLIVSQMVDPAKVLAFLDLTGSWDPSLAFVMIGAIVASGTGYLFAKRRRVPILETRLEIPVRGGFDARLLGGAALFGIGWGLMGLCPGPAVAILSFGLWQGFLFIASMLIGMALFTALPAANVGASPHLSKVDA